LSADSELSIRNLSAQATSGRKNRKFVPTTRTTITAIAIATFASDPSLTAAPM
jgi:hypothetical protein